MHRLWAPSKLIVGCFSCKDITDEHIIPHLVNSLCTQRILPNSTY